MTKIRKKRWKKMPWRKYRSIEKRFLDLRFTGVENALNHYARCEEGDRDNLYYVGSSPGTLPEIVRLKLDGSLKTIKKSSDIVFNEKFFSKPE